MNQQHWKEMIPVDRYVVRASGIIHEYDRNVLTTLYQPLIGSLCFSLYMTLWSELEKDRLWGQESTHHHLMVLMQLNLRQIHQERLKLEGIGLLRTYVKEENESRIFIYELQPPLSPYRFFNDGVLNVYLYNRVGKNLFHKIKRSFSDEVRPQGEFSDVTRSFNEVFQSLHEHELSPNFDQTNQDLLADDGLEYVDHTTSKAPTVQDDVFNFDLFYAGLTDTMIPKRAITTKVKEAIKKLAFLYGIDALQMKNIVIGALNENDQVDIEQLRKSARDYYQFSNGDTLPSLGDTIQPPALRTMEEKEPTTQEEQLIKQLETTSPRQLLVDFSGGAEPAKTELQMIEDVMFKQKLPAGVVNVLIYYVMLRTDMKLSKAYMEKIASHWARKNLKTVREAMELAKQEHKQYQNWPEAKQAKSTSSRRVVRKEMVPKWLNEQKEEQPQQSNDEAPASSSFEEEKRKLEEELKQYRKDKS
ncbi:replication initiation and membrane attachment family protein [Priestia koreensis]|uniref:replication initiation and membrane attachment family protein n=1 Tax=Priestia koreensis TaxID=284581 RepID=UPI001F5AE014|nr:replication initiation and membrane attachment family protein [Priestia koreensis]UNL84458.1 replication initiation and membrane attachment family protein [Priestia koreensis]